MTEPRESTPIRTPRAVGTASGLAARFAPSPTGPLHIGSARTAFAAFCQARSLGARFILRIEDLDPPRVRAGAEQSILDELRWLGVEWSEGPDLGGRHAPYRQSARTDGYVHALGLLRERGAVYPCACSRRDVEQASHAPHGAEPIYPGTCADRESAEVLAQCRAARREPSWRFRVGSGAVTFDDGVFGAVSFVAGVDFGDFVVRRADGLFAYQLAVLADDAAMGVTHVLRGADLLDSTPRQILLARALGQSPPTYAHVPLVVGPDGERLAKRHGHFGVRDLRSRGIEAEAFRARIWASLGQIEPVRPEAFDLARVPKEPVVVDTIAPL